VDIARVAAVAAAVMVRFAHEQNVQQVDTEATETAAVPVRVTFSAGEMWSDR